jgi:hypothetical protein
MPGDLGAGRLNNLILEHVYRSWKGIYPLSSPGQFHPVPGTLAYSDNHLGTAFIYAVYLLLGCDLETAFRWLVDRDSTRALRYGGESCQLDGCGRRTVAQRPHVSRLCLSAAWSPSSRIIARRDELDRKPQNAIVNHKPTGSGIDGRCSAAARSFRLFHGFQFSPVHGLTSLAPAGWPTGGGGHGGCRHGDSGGMCDRPGLAPGTRFQTQHGFQ